MRLLGIASPCSREECCREPSTCDLDRGNATFICSGGVNFGILEDAKLWVSETAQNCHVMTICIIIISFRCIVSMLAYS